MAMYVLAIMTLIKLSSVDKVTQKWYADDKNAVGRLSNLRIFLEEIVSIGKFFGYHVTASKCQRIIEDKTFCKAEKICENTGITVKAGARVLVQLYEQNLNVQNSLIINRMSKSEI